MTECNGCGTCCDPVPLPVTQMEVRLGKMDLGERERRWILEELTPISRRQALELAPYLNTGGRTDFMKGPDGAVIYPTFYRCKWFDRETRACTNHADRPDVCRGYPWHEGRPDKTTNLPHECSFRADQGLPVEPVPVMISRRTALD